MELSFEFHVSWEKYYQRNQQSQNTNILAINF